MIIKAVLLGASSTLAIVLAPQAAAQTTPSAPSTPPAATTQPPQDEANNEIVVTGSRIIRDGYQAPTPVTVSTSEALQLAAPTTLTDGLNQLPQFRGSSRPQTGGVSANGAVGANLLNLRNLGSQRNLILLDGRRVVASTTSGVTNIDVLPQNLVQRVETVTGGASAAYGSDAVAGVVNFILDTKFSGLKLDASAGISTYGDAGTQKVSAAFGTDIGSRLHLIASAEYYNSEGLGPYTDRPFNQRTAGIINNVPGTARPARLTPQEGVGVAVATFGGLITSGPFAGTQFGPGGEPEPFIFGTTRSTFQVGGTNVRNDVNLTAGLRRITSFAHLDYEPTDSIKIYAEGLYADSKSVWDQYYNYSYTTAAATIFSGNPFIPDSIQQQMDAQNIPSFQLGRIHSEATIGAENHIKMARGVLGIDGKISPSWSFDAYYTHGWSNSRIANTNVLNNQKYYAAVDAVRDPASGNTVCRATLLYGIQPDCVPFDPFGAGAPSQAALDYITDDEFRDLTLEQDVAAASITGSLFSLWAEPISVAVGGEYRREKAHQFVDSQSTTHVDFTNIRGGPSGINGQLGPFIVGNPQPVAGSFNVKEGFVEVDIPVVKDVPVFRLLNINAAARLTDYSTSGTVTTWKVGVNYKPIDDLRFRATRSRDIRGPNIAELFTGSSQSIGTLRSPQGTTESFVGSTQGNPDLDPERADTLTAGVVYQPSWLRGFDVSVDYYNIKISGAIAALGAQDTVDECARGSAVACSNIQIVGGVYRVRLPNLNLNELKTKGLDIEMSYRTQDFLGGSLFLRGLANYQPQFITQTPGAPPIDRAGETGQSENPKWLATVSATYERGPVSLFVQERFISAGFYNATYTEGVDIDDNHIPAQFYTDLTLRLRTGPSNRYELFATVNNLFNREPPFAPQQSGTHLRWSNYNLYDPVGRYMTAGVRLRF